MRTAGSRARGCRTVTGCPGGWGHCQLCCLWGVRSTSICRVRLVLTFEKLLLRPALPAGEKPVVMTPGWEKRDQSHPWKEELGDLVLWVVLALSMRSGGKTAAPFHGRHLCSQKQLRELLKCCDVCSSVLHVANVEPTWLLTKCLFSFRDLYEWRLLTTIKITFVGDSITIHLCWQLSW